MKKLTVLILLLFISNNALARDIVDEVSEAYGDSTYDTYDYDSPTAEGAPDIPPGPGDGRFDPIFGDFLEEDSARDGGSKYELSEADGIPTYEVYEERDRTIMNPNDGPRR
jgi:hypothetical protein